jgi:hypothetical protein
VRRVVLSDALLLLSTAVWGNLGGVGGSANVAVRGVALRGRLERGTAALGVS